MDDVIQALIAKAQVPDENAEGRIRIYETSSHRFYREPPREHPVLNLNEYTQIFAERVPSEETSADENNFINVFHFQNEVNRVHGVPFKFLLLEVRHKLTIRKDEQLLTKFRERISVIRKSDSRREPVSRVKVLRRSSLRLFGGRIILSHSI